MTPREHRLRRLVELREKQHDVTVVHLRSAQAELHASEIAVSQAEEAARAVRNQGRAAAISGNAEDWLLASAEGELSSLDIRQRHAVRARAGLAVDAAAEQEAAARLERKQMEFTLDRIRREAESEAARAEQHAQGFLRIAATLWATICKYYLHGEGRPQHWRYHSSSGNRCNCFSRNKRRARLYIGTKR